MILVSKRTQQKYKILYTLKNSELTTEDLTIYTETSPSNITPIINDLKRWNNIKIVKTELNNTTRKKRNVYTITDKGKEKLFFLIKKYNFKWRPKQIY
jgi:DNA-binding PadR family transcriptional regulator